MRIQELIIQVGDIEQAVAFYTKVVGLKHVRTVEHEGATVAELDADGQRVTLMPSSSPGMRLALQVPSIQARRRRLGREKVSMADGGPVELAGGAWLSFTDPWGNQLGYWEERGEQAAGD